MFTIVLLGISYLDRLVFVSVSWTLFVIKAFYVIGCLVWLLVLNCLKLKVYISDNFILKVILFFHCSMTGVTIAMTCDILSEMEDIKSERVAHVVVTAGFISRYLSGPLP